MKRLLLTSLFVVFAFTLQPFAFSLGDTNDIQRMQALAIAQEIVEEKSDKEYGQDRYEYENYQNSEDYQVDIDDYDREGSDKYSLSTNMSELDLIKIARRKAQAEVELLKEKRMLENEKAWLLDQPSTTTNNRALRRVRGNPLKEKAQKKIVSIDFSDAQLKNILKYLSKISDINIIFDEASVESAGDISIHVKDVSVLKTLEMILRTKGLGYRFEEDYIWITSKSDIQNEEMVTRIYHLSQGLATFTTFTTFDTVTVKPLRADNDVIVGVTGEEAGTNGRSVETFEGVKVGGSSGIAGKISMTIKDVLDRIITWPEGSSIFLDNRTSTLIARNTPTNLSLLEQALDVLDVAPPQVMIEARFVEVGDDDLLSLGFKFSGEVSAEGATAAHTWPFKKGQDDDYNYPFADGVNLGVGVLDFQEFGAVLSAIEQNASSNTLSSPKITTISGQEAIIKIVKEYRYPTRYEIQTIEVSSGDTTTSTPISVPADFKTRDIGIILKVTPNVGADGETINLTLVPEVSEFDITRDMYNYGTTANPYFQPFFNVRNATASIIINNSDTVVMGGLMKETVESAVDKVPVIGSLPLIGRLFSRKYDNKQKRNLLIFVTARIIAPSGEEVLSSSLR